MKKLRSNAQRKRVILTGHKAHEAGKDIWDKLKIFSIVLATVLVPVAVAFMGNEYKKGQSESSNSVKYTELAIEILKSPPTSASQDVRDWAVDVMNKYSGVTINSKTRNELIGSQLFEWSDITGAGYNFPDINDYERAVRFLVREPNNGDPDPEYTLSSGYISYADDEWWEGHSSVGPDSEYVILVGEDVGDSKIEIQVQEYDYSGNLVINTNFEAQVFEEKVIFIYRTTTQSLSK